MKYIILSRKGSITVEAALIVPIVIIALMTVLYIVLLIFQTCIMQITADNTAERAAAVYFSCGSYVDGSISKAEISDLGLYRRWSLNPIMQQGDLKSYALRQLQANSILKSKNPYLDIYQRGSIISRRLEVVLSADYENPLGSLTALWGLDRKIKLRVMAQAVVDDPAEFIRNTDFIMEAASKVPVISQFEEKWQEIINRIIEYVNRFAKEHKTFNEEE